MGSRLYSPMDIDLFVQQAGDTGGGGGGGSSNGLKVVYEGNYAGRPDGSLLSKKEIIYCTDISKFGGIYMKPKDIGGNEYTTFNPITICERIYNNNLPVEDTAVGTIFDEIIFPTNFLTDFFYIDFDAFFIVQSPEGETPGTFQYEIFAGFEGEPDEDAIPITSTYEPSIIDSSDQLTAVNIRAFFTSYYGLIGFFNNKNTRINLTQYAAFDQHGPKRIRIFMKIKSLTPESNSSLLIIDHSITLRGM